MKFKSRASRRMLRLFDCSTKTKMMKTAVLFVTALLCSFVNRIAAGYYLRGIRSVSYAHMHPELNLYQEPPGWLRRVVASSSLRLRERSSGPVLLLLLSTVLSWLPSRRSESWCIFRISCSGRDNYRNAVYLLMRLRRDYEAAGPWKDKLTKAEYTSNAPAGVEISLVQETRKALSSLTVWRVHILKSTRIFVLLYIHTTGSVSSPSTKCLQACTARPSLCAPETSTGMQSTYSIEQMSDSSFGW